MLGLALKSSSVRKLLTSSSDFSRVRVLRPTTAGGPPKEILCDETASQSGQPVSGDNALRLRAGDIIEVPEKE